MKLSVKFAALLRKPSYKLGFAFTAMAVVIVLSVGVWFQRTHVGWLIESVPEPMSFLQTWQWAIAEDESLKHPAIIHQLPNHCLCSLLTMGHAAKISTIAKSNGYHLYQVGTQHQKLGGTVSLSSPDLSPTIAITDEQGQIKYLGAYSDGVRCTEANSLVDAFVAGVSFLPTSAIVGLDVKVCRCEPSL